MTDSTASKELGASRKPPGEVVAAICLLAGNQVFGWVVVPLAWDYLTAPQGPATFIMNLALSATLSLFIFFKVYQGKNWARVLLLVLMLGGLALSLTDLVIEFVRQGPPVLRMQFAVSMALNAVAVWLLFFSEGRAWFSRGANGARQ